MSSDKDAAKKNNFQKYRPPHLRGRDAGSGRRPDNYAGASHRLIELGVAPELVPGNPAECYTQRDSSQGNRAGECGARKGAVFKRGAQGCGTSGVRSPVSEPFIAGPARGPRERQGRAVETFWREERPQTQLRGAFEATDRTRNVFDGSRLLAPISLMNLSTLKPETMVQKVDSQLKEFQQALGNAEIVKSESLDAVVLILSKLVKLASGPEGLEQRMASKIVAEILNAERCAQFHFHFNQAVKATACTHRQLEDLCNLFSSLLNKFESLAWECLPVDELCETTKRLTKVSSIPSALLQKAEELCVTRDQIRDLHSEKANKTTSDGERFDYEFMFIPILPEWEEIKEDKGIPPEVRPNKVDTPYKDWMEYYDIQFRLIREDFIAPLRRGVAAFLQGDKGKNNRDVTIYSAAKIVSQVTTKNRGIRFVIQFDASGFCKVNYNWDQSKRLIFGSLLCFIPMGKVAEDAIIFATVADRDHKNLTKGVFMAQFEEDILKAMTHCSKGTKFEIVESKSYFGATSPILRSIQKAEVDTMPFTKQLIEGKCESVPPPTYLRNKENAIIYNLSCLHGPVKKRKRKPPLMIEVLNKESWEAARDSELDSSQLNAIQTALTQEIAVIQGPPGTGKTYIGLKIVEALVENRDVWDPNKSCPILVMCYTNHALDQFLEGIIDTECCGRKPNVIRVGGRGKNEKVNACNLSQIRRFLPIRRNHDLTDEFSWVKEEMERCNPENIWKNLKHKFNDNGFLSLSTLCEVAHPYHYYQLSQMAQCKKEQGRELEMWLGSAKPMTMNKLFPTGEEMKQNTDTEHFGSSHVTKGDKMQHSAKESQGKPTTSPGVSESKEDLIEIQGEAKDDRMDYEDIEGFQRVSPVRVISFKNDDKSEASQQTGYSIVRIRKDHMNYEEVEELANINIQSLSIRDRWRLYNHWEEEWFRLLEEENMMKVEMYNDYCRELAELRQHEDKYVLETADVVGMTTTGAAKYQHILHGIKPKIVIVEEAAEVLEAHIVSALSAGTQHLILIGDHKQLRPKPNEHVLATDYSLSISLFERLVMKQMSQATLEIQHRMRPEIAQLVCPHVYEKLLNHESVEKYPDIRGISKNLFFVCHTQPESENPNLLSYQNDFEAKYIVGLCAHLLRLGYSPSQITILTPYVGQLLLIRDKMPKSEFEGVRVTAIDNFQGEENDIVLFSMVRSTNPNCSRTTIGFVKEDNRVCVSLSRAKQGFYAIGNFELIRHQSQLWESIISDVESRECYGNALPLYCCNHPETKYSAMKDSDFIANAPNGGCRKMCDIRLPCGHSCAKICHAIDPDHKNYLCQKTCKYTFNCGHTHTVLCSQMSNIFMKCPTPCLMVVCERGHKCRRTCHYPKPCGLCYETVTIRFPKCLHEQKLMCYLSTHPQKYEYICKWPCEKKLSCGHSCPKKCGEDCETHCLEEVAIMLNCGHYTKVKCYSKHTLNSVVCTEQVNCELACGHSFKCPCWQKQKNLLNACREKCPKILDCGHQCSSTCGSNCTELCRKNITKELHCGHIVECECYQIQRMEPSLHCPEKCTAVLSCGHNCSGKCGDCYSSRMHAICVFEIRLLRFCGHSVTLPCAGLSDSCNYRTHTALCSHIKDYSNCHKPCTWECKHFQCTKDCSEECDRPPCNEPCDKELHCGHMCPGLCGERCMSVCIQCDPQSFTKQFHPKPEQNCLPIKQPLFELPCRHIFTVRYLDEYMLSKIAAVRPKQCLKCHRYIGVGNRYSNAVRMAITDVRAIENVIAQHKSVAEVEKEELRFTAMCQKHTDPVRMNQLLCLGKRSLIEIRNKLDRDLPVSAEESCLIMCADSLSKLNESLLSYHVRLDDVKSCLRILMNAFIVAAEKYPNPGHIMYRFQHTSPVDIHLSWQLLEDFMSELYRLALSAQCIISRSQLPPISSEATKEWEMSRPRYVVISVEQYIECLDPLKDRISEAQYEERYFQLSLAFPDVANIYVNTPHVLEVVKGTWKKCPAGHYYCLPPVCGAGATRTDDCCPDCQ